MFRGILWVFQYSLSSFDHLGIQRKCNSSNFPPSLNDLLKCIKFVYFSTEIFIVLSTRISSSALGRWWKRFIKISNACCEFIRIVFEQWYTLLRGGDERWWYGKYDSIKNLAIYDIFFACTRLIMFPNAFEARTWHVILTELEMFIQFIFKVLCVEADPKFSLSTNSRQAL